MSPGPMVGRREDPSLVTESRYSKVITNAPPLRLALKLVFRLKDGLIMGLVVQRIGLLKTFIQPSPEAGDRAVSFHILLRAASLLAHHLAECHGKLCSDNKIRMQEAGWVIVTKLCACFSYCLSLVNPMLNTDS